MEIKESRLLNLRSLDGLQGMSHQHSTSDLVHLWDGFWGFEACEGQKVPQSPKTRKIQSNEKVEKKWLWGSTQK